MEVKRRTLAPNVIIDATALQDVLNAILGLADWYDKLFSQVLDLTLKQECLVHVLKSKQHMTDEEMGAIQDQLRAGISVERALAGKQTAVERLLSHFSALIREYPPDEQKEEAPRQ